MSKNNELKKYLIEWLFDNTEEDVLIGVDLSNPQLKFPFVWADKTSFLKLRYVKSFNMDEKGLSALLKIKAITEMAFIPFESIFAIISESKTYTFSFVKKETKTHDGGESTKKPKLTVIK